MRALSTSRRPKEPSSLTCSRFETGVGPLGEAMPPALPDTELTQKVLQAVRRPIPWNSLGLTEKLAEGAFGTVTKGSLFGTEVAQQYADAADGAALSALPPHPYAQVEAAYREVLSQGCNQSLVVSGESGAGKTELTKICLRFLVGHAHMGDDRLARVHHTHKTHAYAHPCPAILR